MALMNGTSGHKPFGSESQAALLDFGEQLSGLRRGPIAGIASVSDPLNGLVIKAGERFGRRNEDMRLGFTAALIHGVESE
jgi:hypothetical protein